MSTCLSGISILPCVGILASAAYLYTVPEARQAMDRISFRLMLVTMFFELGFNILVFVLGPWQTVNADGKSCIVIMYWLIASLSVCNYLCTAIAINLMLCISFRLDPVRLRLERWYIVGSIALAFVIPIAPAALGFFGDDPVFGPGVCYFTGDIGKSRMLHQVFGVYLWQTLSALIAAGAVASVILTLGWHGRQTARALIDGDAANRELVANDATLNQLHHQLVNISLKISLYPVTLFVLNTVLTVGDLIPSAQGLPSSEATFGLLVVWDILYGTKSMWFAGLGIFVDPCLRKAWRIALARRRATDSATCFGSTSLSAEPEVSVTPTHATASTWAHDQELDFATALRDLPYEDGLAVSYGQAVLPAPDLLVADLRDELESVKEIETSPKKASSEKATRRPPSRSPSRPSAIRRSLRLSGEHGRLSQASYSSRPREAGGSFLGEEISEALEETIKRL